MEAVRVYKPRARGCPPEHSLPTLLSHLNALQVLLVAYEQPSVGERAVSVVSPRTLYRMKRNTVRLKDRADAELLKRRFGLNEED